MSGFHLVGLLAMTFSLALGSCATQPTTTEDGTRPFRMGFTPWPADLTVEGVTTSMNFAHEHGDIVSIMMNGGLPWQEALENRAFSSDVQRQLAYRPPQGKKLFVSISVLDTGREGLAPYWGEHDNMPLPANWTGLAMNDPKVKKAYLAFCLRVIDRMHPDYLAIGVENNVLLSKRPTKWAELKELHRDTYLGLKRSYPSLPVLFTTDIGHYLKFAPEAKGKDQQGEVAEMMKYSDLFAMSLYPYFNLDFKAAMSPGFLDFARMFHKPIAVSESGMTSRDVTLKSYHVTLNGSEAKQRQFTESLLAIAKRDRYEFVINFATTDFEKLVAKLPPASSDLASIWAFTGMQTSSSAPKPAQVPWDRFYRMRYVR